MPTDKFGIPYFYATAKDAGVTGSGDGFFWEQDSNIRDDQDRGMVRLGKESDDVDVISTTTGEWEFPFASGADYFCLEVRQGHKSGGEEHGCEGSCYIFNVKINENPAKFYYQKQMYHGGSKFTDPTTGTFGHASVTEKVVGNGWKGFAAVIYNKENGRSTGHDSAILETWWNEDPVANIANWFKVGTTEDKGGWGTDGDSCEGADDQVITWSNIQFRYKSGTPDFSLHPLIPEFEDGPVIHSIGGADMSFEDSEARGYGKRADMPANVEMKCLFKFDTNNGICRLKNLSLREIDPSIALTDNPDDPDPTEEPGTTNTIFTNFQFNQDINTLRSSPCAGTGVGGGGGGEVGNAVFWNIAAAHDTILSNSSANENRTRVAEKIKSSSSSLRGQKPRQVDVPLKKDGSPGSSPTIHCKIWNSSGTVVYDSPTTVDPSTLTSSFTYKIFDFSTNTHTLVVGDIIGVEWTGTSDTNYPQAGYENESVSEASVYVNYENGSWEEKGSRDWAARIWN